MHVSRRFGWWGLYALIPLVIGLMALDEVLPMTETWHLVLSVAIILVTCVLAIAWIEQNARFIETDGLDGLGAYCVLLDTADGPSAEPVMREAYQAREQRPAAERNKGVCSPTSRTMAEGARGVQ